MLVSQPIKVITLWQPWASLIALGLKKYETRSWGTNYRGKLVIHAAKRPIDRDEVLPILYATGGGGVNRSELDRLEKALEEDLPLGAIVAIADLTKCLQMMNGWVETNPEPGFTIIQGKSALEQAVGDWKPGRYAWRLDNVIALPESIPFKGAQGLRDLTDTAVLQAIAQGVRS